jgi:hypothetical protein
MNVAKRQSFPPIERAGKPTRAWNMSEKEVKNMKNKLIKLVSLLLVAALMLPLAACDGEKPAEVDGAKLVQSILSQVTFADTLSATGDAAIAALYFPELPTGAKAEIHLGSGYFADEVALITLASDKDAKAGKTSAEKHVQQIRAQFANYIPEELGKIDNAYIWHSGKFIIVAITDDIASVKDILNHADDPSYKVPGRPAVNTTQPPQTTAPGTTQPGATEPGTTQAPQTTVPAQTTQPPVTTQPGATVTPQDPTVATRPDGYPAINSQSGTYSYYPGSSMLRVDNRAFEACGFSASVAKTYADLVSKVADKLAGKTTVYSMAIPTSFGVMLPDDIRANFPNYQDQGESIQTLFAMMSENVVSVPIYDDLMRHRNEYLYFRTDHHWNGIGAYYAYEGFCDVKGITPYTMAQREEKQFGDFLGTLYINGGKDQNLLPTDTVFAYKPYSKTATMVFYDKNGVETKWPIIANVEGWGQGAKYSTFAGADNPLTVFTNPEVTDGSVCIVVKESYGNAFMPYIVDHYSTVYEIDYRYWKGDLATYAEEVGADDMIFANNIMMISTTILVGMLADNVQ